MAKDKLRRFAEFKTFKNTFDFPYELKGKWNSDVFHNDHPIILELGCGKGEYTVGLAKRFPETNFIGIDIKSNRMWKGAGTAHNENLNNTAFVRMVMHKISEVFAPGEVSGIWITFPDPFPKLRHAKHRLTHPRFLELYCQVLIPGGMINFKTDSDELFAFTVDMLPRIGIMPEVIDHDVHGNQDLPEYLKTIRTHYENIFLKAGKKIKYTRFSTDNLDEKRVTQFIKELEEERKKAPGSNKANGK